jgi:hypothetical protein
LLLAQLRAKDRSFSSVFASMSTPLIGSWVLKMLFEVVRHRSKQRDVLVNETESLIAPTTEQPAHCIGIMVVVDAQGREQSSAISSIAP